MKRIQALLQGQKVRYYLRLLTIILVMIGFFYYIPLTQFVVVVKNASIVPFFKAAVLGLIAIYVGSIELWVLARKQGIFISVSRLFILNLGTRFYSFVSPISSLGSILRWHRLSINGKPTEGLMTLAANRVLDVIIAISVGLFWAITLINDRAIDISLIVVYLIGLMMVLWLVLRICTPVADWAGEKRRNEQLTLRSKGYLLLEQLFRSISVYRSFSSQELIVLVLTALTGEIITLLAYVLLAISVHIPISIADLGWMRSLLFLAALTPFTLVGGIGLREVSAVLIMSGLGVPADQATAFSFLLYARGLVLSLIGGGVELVYFIFDRRIFPAS